MRANPRRGAVADTDYLEGSMLPVAAIAGGLNLLGVQEVPGSNSRNSPVGGSATADIGCKPI